MDNGETESGGEFSDPTITKEPIFKADPDIEASPQAGVFKNVKKVLADKFSPKEKEFPNDLTEEEKQLLNQKISTFNATNDSQEKLVIESELVEIGNRALPYLRGKIPVYSYSVLTDAFATPEELDLILEGIKRPVDKQDYGVFDNFKQALQRITYEIRLNNPYDPLLERIAQVTRGIALSPDVTSNYVKDAVSYPLAMTGTKTAQKYISKHYKIDDDYYQYAENLSNVHADINRVIGFEITHGYLAQKVIDRYYHRNEQSIKSAETPDPSDKLNYFQRSIVETDSTEVEPLTEEEIATLDNEIPALVIGGPPWKADIVSANLKIGMIGRKALPYLKGKILDKYYAEFIDALSSSADLDLVLETLEDLSNKGRSNKFNLVKVVTRQLFVIREKNPDDPRLKEAEQRLRVIFGQQLKSSKSYDELMMPICISGQSDFESLLDRENVANDQFNKEFYLNLWANPRKIQDFYMEYSHEAMKLNTNAKQYRDKIESDKKGKEQQEKFDEEYKNWLASQQPVEEPDLPKPVPQPEQKKDSYLQNPLAQIEYPQAYETKDSDPFAQMDDLFERKIPIEQMIQIMEKKLGIETSLQRAQEASLLIDSKFMIVGILRGDKHLERLFGDQAWADWLSARVAARSYGNQPLTVEFMKYIHSRLTRRSNSEIEGNIRKDLTMGGNYSNPVLSIEFTDEQLQAINENPLLTFIRTGGNKNIGKIKYPAAYNPKIINSLSPEAKLIYQKLPNTEKLIEALLFDLCSWYNSEKSKPDHNPYELAAKLQQRIISIHPFMDVNGRGSRVLMDWSLENDGVAPAILDEPSNDIFSTEAQWISEVKSGSREYQTNEHIRQQLEKIGYENQAEVMGLSPEKTFYDLIYKRIQIAPEVDPSAEVMDHQSYEKFLADFGREYQQFIQEFSQIRKRGPEREFIRFSQGDLIPTSYMELLQLSVKDREAYEQYLREQYFGDQMIYRGGRTPDRVEEKDLVRMFDQYVGLGTGYDALEKARVSPLSTRNVPRGKIASALGQYNLLLAAEYMRKHHPLEAPINQNKFGQIITDHLNLNNLTLKYSPFASTSLSRDISEQWGTPNNYDIQWKLASTGVLFSAVAPEYGGILAFGDDSIYTNRGEKSDIPGLADINFGFASEQELMVPGGLDPVSIQEILVKELEDNVYGGKSSWKTFLAHKEVTDQGIFLRIFNYKNQTQSVYKLDDQLGKYQLQEQVPIVKEVEPEALAA